MIAKAFTGMPLQQHGVSISNKINVVHTLNSLILSDSLIYNIYVFHLALPIVVASVTSHYSWEQFQSEEKKQFV